MACDALAARFTRAWSANADPPTIALHLKPWRGRSRTRRTTFSRRRAVFLIGATRHDPQSVIRQWPLQVLADKPNSRVQRRRTPAFRFVASEHTR